MSKNPGIFETVAHRATAAAGSTWAFMLAAATVVVWLVSGPIFGYSDSWQLVINTGTTIVTFLMVFLIQRSQNKDAQATHLKLNELVASLDGASNRLINVESLTEADVLRLHRYYEQLARTAKQEDVLAAHSVEETINGQSHAGPGKQAKKQKHRSSAEE